MGVHHDDRTGGGSGSAVVVEAPVRVADVGGWTDTWFAGTGVVCNLAVGPGASVAITPGPDGLVRLVVDADGSTVDLSLGKPTPGVHPLLEAAVGALPPPEPVCLTVRAEVPPGSGLGTSAAVLVALLGALRTTRDEPIDAPDLAALAHRVETSLGRESGVQDHWAAALGGVHLFEVDYPEVEALRVGVPDDVLADLDRRLVTVSLGRPHDSSAMHRRVIARLEQPGAASALEPLREAASAAAIALAYGQLAKYGEALVANTDAQANLDPSLVSAEARAAFDIAAGHGAVGWKVNGAGGDGGSVTIVGPAAPAPLAALRAELAGHEPWTVLDLGLCATGVRVRPTSVGRAGGAG